MKFIPIEFEIDEDTWSEFVSVCGVKHSGTIRMVLRAALKQWVREQKARNEAIDTILASVEQASTEVQRGSYMPLSKLGASYNGRLALTQTSEPRISIQAYDDITKLVHYYNCEDNRKGEAWLYAFIAFIESYEQPESRETKNRKWRNSWGDVEIFFLFEDGCLTVIRVIENLYNIAGLVVSRADEPEPSEVWKGTQCH